MGGASRDPIRECSDRGLIAVLYCGSHRVRMLTQLSSRNFLSTLRRATSSCPFCSTTRLARVRGEGGTAAASSAETLDARRARAGAQKREREERAGGGGDAQQRRVVRVLFADAAPGGRGGGGTL